MPTKRIVDLKQLISDVHNFHINSSSREIYLHPHYDADSGDFEAGVEHCMATTFVKNLHVLDGDNHSNILVHMQSGGGSWPDGMAIFNAVSIASSPVTILGYAQASSMSGIILQSADKRVLTADCIFMVHYGSISLNEPSLAVKSAVEMNEKESKRMLQLFSKRCKLGAYFKERKYSERQVARFIDRKIKDKGDWFMTASEAVFYGFADGILGEKGFETFDKIRKGRKYKWV